MIFLVKKNLFSGAKMASNEPTLIATMASSLIQPVTCSLINAITGKGIMRPGKEQEDGFLSLLALQ